MAGSASGGARSAGTRCASSRRAGRRGSPVGPTRATPATGVAALYAPRRTVLDPLLVRAAAAAGAEVVHGVTATALERNSRGRVVGAVLEGADGSRRTVLAPIVVGADGMRSRVAALAGAEVERRGRHATALVYGHWAALPVDGTRWYYRPGVSAGAIPTNGGRTCLFVALPPDRFAAALPGGLPALYHRGWALVGDAGYFKDPLTAHGMTDALRDTELLARAIVAGTDRALAEYQALRDEVSLGLFEVTDRIASFAWGLEEAKEAHLALSRHMAAEGELLLALDRDGGVRPASPRRAAEGA